MIMACTVLLMSCANQNEQVNTEVEVVEEAPIEVAFFGSEISEDGARPSSTIVEQLAGLDSVRAKVSGEIQKVCQVKGCWMTMKVSDDQSMHVSFKDYEFFVPKNIDGKEAIIEGYAYMETMSVDDLKHYAEDEGKSREEIDLIVEPVTKLSFVADGVIVKDYKVEVTEESAEDAPEANTES
jgi:hypothetical protein